MTYKGGYVPIRQLLRELYLGNKVPSRLYLGFHARDIPENQYLAFPVHTVKNVESLVDGHFT
jgi:hypothetical protein